MKGNVYKFIYCLYQLTQTNFGAVLGKYFRQLFCVLNY